jgi:hypothetical protein
MRRGVLLAVAESPGAVSDGGGAAGPGVCRGLRRRPAPTCGACVLAPDPKEITFRAVSWRSEFRNVQRRRGRALRFVSVDEVQHGKKARC